MNPIQIRLEKFKRRVSVSEGIANGERAIEEGRFLTHAEAKKRMMHWLSRSPKARLERGPSAAILQG